MGYVKGGKELPAGSAVKEKVDSLIRGGLDIGGGQKKKGWTPIGEGGKERVSLGWGEELAIPLTIMLKRKGGGLKGS